MTKEELYERFAFCWRTYHLDGAFEKLLPLFHVEPDKDEQEFEVWYKTDESPHCTQTTKAALKHAWMAGRGK